MMQRRLLGLLACVSVFAASCQSSAPSSAPPAATEPGPPAQASAPPDVALATEQILRIDIRGEPPTLDPTQAQTPTVLRALHRGLVDFDQDFNVVPALAESWTISHDSRTLTFRLRDARYSNGDPIVAGDFVYSWKRLADPRIAAMYSYAIAEVVGGPDLLAMPGAVLPSDAAIEAALSGLGVEAPDDKTFIVHLNRPATYFLSAMTLWVFVPLQEKWITSARATDPANYVSSGPFILDAWDHDSQIVLKPNPNWWGDVKPTLTEIRMSMYAGPAQAQLAYETGELDIVVAPDSDIERIRTDPVLSAEYREVSQLAILYYSFNNFQDPNAVSYARPGPTANKDFRMALTQAIDKQAYIDATFAGLGEVANSFIMPGIPGHQPDLDPYPYDLDSARQHMAKALAELGVASAAELGKLKFGFPSGFGREPQVAFLAEAWRQAFGLEIDQISGERITFSTERDLGKYDLSFTGWAIDYPHANNQLSGPFTCGGGNNSAQYCNPDFDALIARAAAEPDQARQLAIYNEAQTLLMSDAPILPVNFLVTPYEVKPYVAGLTVMSFDGFDPGHSFFETIRILGH